jgi:steroid 5-alpha reductase family enzyme
MEPNADPRNIAPWIVRAAYGFFAVGLLGAFGGFEISDDLRTAIVIAYLVFSLLATLMWWVNRRESKSSGLVQAACGCMAVILPASGYFDGLHTLHIVWGVEFVAVLFAAGYAVAVWFGRRGLNAPVPGQGTT